MHSHPNIKKDITTFFYNYDFKRMPCELVVFPSFLIA